MPKTKAGKKSASLRHAPLGQVIEKPSGKLRAPRSGSGADRGGDEDGNADDVMVEDSVPASLGKKIFSQAREQRLEESQSKSGRPSAAAAAAGAGAGAAADVGAAGAVAGAGAAAAVAGAGAAAATVDEVQHEPARCRFVLRSGRRCCFLEYIERADSAFDILHTYVPPALRGKRLGLKLCDAAYSYAEKKGLRVIPTCTFVREKFHFKERELP